jgi:exopolysaccharide biosynthesis protein
MKEIKVVSRHSVIANEVFTFCLVLIALLFGNSYAQDWKAVADGVEYARVRREFSGKPVNLNLLRFDLTKVRLDVHHAMDMAIGTEKTSSIAIRHGAFAAINAGFFRLDKSEFAGDNVGFLMIDDYLWSEPTMERVAIGIINRSKKTDVFFDRWKFAGYLRLKSGDHPDLLKGLNREIKDNEVIAYTPSFGKVTPRRGDEIRIRIQKNRVVGVCQVDCEIPKDGFVLVGTGERSNVLKQLKIGDRAEFVWDIRGENNTSPSSKLEDAVAGVPQLIKDGKIDITWEREKASRSFVETRHPRTAVAKLKGGKFLMLTADGRSEQSAGLDLYDLAEYMLELGAVDAMNLDGGGSTTMFLDGKVVNNPSDRDGERKVGDAILVTLRKPKRK